MKSRGKLIRLSVGGKTADQSATAPPRRRIRRRAFVATGLTIAICLAAVWGGKLAAEQVVPQRVVVRGCWLTDSEDVLEAVGFTGKQSVGELRRAARKFECDQARWLRGLRVTQDSLQTAMVTVEERNPLLRLTVNGDRYWLCDDGAVVAQDAGLDTGQVFDAIVSLPAVEVQVTNVGQLPDLTSSAVLAAALCQEVLPGTIKKIVITDAGEIDLYDKSDFRIRLGKPEMLEEKIGALPKALRICEQRGNDLQYLDARDPEVFYEKWEEPISK